MSLRLGSKARRLRQYAQVMLPGRRAAYLGFTDLSNLGDGALFLAHRLAFPRLRFIRVASVEHARAIARAPMRGGLDAIFLGGGTLVGRPNYRQRLRVVMETFPETPAFALGVGVEEPIEIDGQSRTSYEELLRWRPLLERFEFLGVRGPRSKAMLQEVGLDSVVAGDPALLLGGSEPLSRVEGRILGLNIALSSPIWGGDVDLVRNRLSEAGRLLIDDGWRLKILVVWQHDAVISQNLADRTGPGVEVVDTKGSPSAYLKEVADCSLLVGMRLHSVVLASCVGVPSLAIEYRPKCRDFQASIRREEYTIRSDQLEPEDVTERVRQLYDTRSGHRTAIVNAVDELRTRLREAVHVIDASLSGLPQSRPIGCEESSP